MKYLVIFKFDSKYGSIETEACGPCAGSEARDIIEHNCLNEGD
jgi:hypothetical protein